MTQPSDNTSAPVAIVTGGARGIGAATGRTLAAAGWRVALVDACNDDPALDYHLATKSDLDDAVASCAGDAIGVVADVRVQRALDEAVAETVERFGRIDAAIAAAGAIAGGATAWETDDLVWQTMIDINLTGAWRLVRAATPALLANPDSGRGRIVVVASAASLDGLPQLGAYTAAKHGVTGLVKALAVELGPHGITANAVCPGSTRTAMLDASAALYGLADAEDFVQHQALGRLLEPEEIASAIAWLCSAEASAITGAVIPVDGGMTA